MRSRILIVALVLSLLVLGPAATASADFGAEGTMTLKLDRALLGSLRADGVQVRAVKPAVRRGNAIRLPVVGGGLERSGAGRLEQAGGLQLVRGGRRATIRRLVLDTSFGSLLASVGGHRLSLAGVGGVGGEDRGFGAATFIRRVALTRAGASAIESRLRRPGLLRPGLRLASATSIVTFTDFTLYGGQARIALAQGFADKLAALGVGVEPLGDGMPAGASPLAPVLTDIYGEAAIDLASGHLRSGDGFALRQTGTTRAVSLRGIEFDLDKRTVGARVRTDPAGTSGVQTFATFATPTTVETNPRTREIAARSVPLSLSTELATALNDGFGAPGLFAAGEALATAAVSLETR